MARRPLAKLLTSLARPRRRARVMVVVQTGRGQVAVPADALREHLARRG